MQVLEKEKRLFIISNSTHYLNVQTYIETHSPGDNYLIFLNKFSPNHQKFISKLDSAKEIKLFKVISNDQKQKFPLNNLQLISFIIQVFLIKINFGITFNKVFISNYLSWKQHFILKQFNCEKIILINDGTAIFKTIELRKTSSRINFSNLNFLVNKYLGANTVEHLHFYSPIKINVAESDSLEIFNFKATNNSNINRKKVYFIGSDLVELGYLHLEFHLDFLNQIKNTFSDVHITYFAHRGESENFLEKYKFLGTVVRDSIPFEERMEKESELPGYVISYSSSVLINLPQVYPLINFSYFPLTKKSIPENSSFQNGYQTLLYYFEKNENSNFGVLPLSLK